MANPYSRYSGAGEHLPDDDMVAFFLNDPVIQQRVTQLAPQAAAQMQSQQAPSPGPVPLQGAVSPTPEGATAQLPQAAPTPVGGPSPNPINNLIDSVLSQSDGVNTQSADSAVAGIEAERAALAQQQAQGNEVGAYQPDENDLPPVAPVQTQPTPDGGGFPWWGHLLGGAGLLGVVGGIGSVMRRRGGATVQPDGGIEPNVSLEAEMDEPKESVPARVQQPTSDGIVDAEFTELDDLRRLHAPPEQLQDFSGASNESTGRLTNEGTRALPVDTEVADTDAQRGAAIDADLRALDDVTLRNAQAALAQGDYEAAADLLAKAGSELTIGNEADADRIGAAIDAALEALPSRAPIRPHITPVRPRIR